MPSSAAEPARPTLFVVRHGAAPTVDELARALAGTFDVVAVDVQPVSDDAAAAVAEVVAAIRANGSPRWLIAGRDAGARLASLVASRTLSGRSGLFGLAGLVLIADRPLPADERSAAAEPPFPRTLTVTAETALALAAAIRRFWVEEAGTGPAVPADVARTIASARTSTRVRALLAERLLADDPDYAPRVLSVGQLATLSAIADRVVPQSRTGLEGADGRIDLAARVDSQLAAGDGDGWRNAALPADPVAYGLALDALAGFERRSPDEQDARLRAIGDSAAGALTAEQLGAWFEDCRVDLVRQWLAHPASLARIGYDGFASGGDTLPLAGFRALGADQHDDWEPTARSPR